MRRVGFLTLPCCAVLAAFLVSSTAHAQFVGVQYGPRAFANAPTGTRAIDLKFDRMDIGIDLDGRVLSGLNNTSKAMYLSYTQYIDLFGRTASFLFALPVVDIDSDIETTCCGEFDGLSLRGVSDPFVQFNLGLVGQEAMDPREFFATEPGLGLSLHTGIRLPVGEYDSSSPLNAGANRFEFRFGFPMSYTWGTPTKQTSLEMSPTFYFFEDNDDPFGGGRLSQEEALQIEVHLVHDFAPTFWGALNALRVWGAATETDGVKADNALDYTSVSASIGGRLSRSLSWSFTYGQRFDSKNEKDDGNLYRGGLTFTF